MLYQQLSFNHQAIVVGELDDPPMQLRGPALNGMKAYGCRPTLFSGRNRSGLKASGSGKLLGCAGWHNTGWITGKSFGKVSSPNQIENIFLKADAKEIDHNSSAFCWELKKKTIYQLELFPLSIAPLMEGTDTTSKFPWCNIPNIWAESSPAPSPADRNHQKPDPILPSPISESNFKKIHLILVFYYM